MQMRNQLTVGKLRKMLENVPDDVIVELASDTGVDQGLGDIIVEDAYYCAPYYNNYRTFIIYANDDGGDF
jgi:hypothetical protein